MNKLIIQLTAGQQQALEAFTSKGQAPARKIKRAHILLKSAEGKWTDAQISQAFGVSETTIWRVRRRFVEHGLDEALNRRPQPERPEKRKLTGDQEAHLVVSKRVVELEIAEQVGRETIRQTLKKMHSNRG